MQPENSLESIDATIDSLEQSQKALSGVQHAFLQDSRRFQAETLKALTQLAVEAQGFRDRLNEVSKVVFGSDNPEALHVQFQLLRRQLQYMEEEIKEIRGFIEAHNQHHSKLVSTADERGWQLRSIIVSALVGAIATAIVIPLFQNWFAVPSKASPDGAFPEEFWFGE